MLQKLVIKNIALIDNAEIIFTEGLNVLSGETGAGKSVIIESLNFVLGAKADKTLIRSGESECFVEADFFVANNKSIQNVFKEFEFEVEDELIITRRYTVEGKSSVKINGNSATVGMLKKFTSALVDVHGQSEHFSLLKTANQLELIDRFGGVEILKIKEKLRQFYLQYKDIINKLENLGGDESARLIRLDVLNYQINEIEKASIADNEEEDLIEIRQKLQFQEKIVSALNGLKCAIDDEGGISDVLSNVSRSVGSITSLSGEYEKLYERVDGAFSEISDIAESAGELLNDLEQPEYDLNEIEERLALIKKIKSKYGYDYQEIYAFLENAKNERDNLENFNERAEKLLNEKVALEENLFAVYNQLSKCRKIYADDFTQKVLGELKELGMNSAQFVINFASKSREDCKFDSANGIDEIEFMFSANLGEPLKSMSLVISGGEMSRFMLAIKAQTARYNDISTFIFDEIDAGISGNIANVVAKKFVKISTSTQLICITHLPQISAMADNNLLIQKNELQNKTITVVKTLNEDEKIKEIVRLVGGALDSVAAINHASELIKTATEQKNLIRQNKVE